MKKTILLIVMALLVTVTVDAQRGKKRGKNSGSKGYYSFTIGPAFPLGDFAATDTTDKAGWAKTGINISLAQLGYKFTDNFGLSGQLMVGANRFDVSSQGWNDDDAYWVYAGLMVGPLVSIPVGDQLEINLKPVIGYSMVATPELNDNDNGVLWESEQVGAMSYDLGASVCYNLSDNFALSLGLDYYGSKVDFKRTVFAGTILETTVDFTQNISVFSTSAGIVLRF